MKAIERLYQYMEYKGLKPTALEKKIGLSNGYLGVQRKRNADMGEGVFLKIIDNCRDINSSWLLTGEGNMLRSESENNKIPNINYESVGTPYYNVDFIGGFDLIVNDQTVNPDFYINYPPYNQEGVVWCNLTGHSMEPEISNGDIIALREVTTDTYPVSPSRRNIRHRHRGIPHSKKSQVKPKRRLHTSDSFK